MASPTARRIGQLVGGLLIGALSAIAWAARLRPSAPSEPPSATRPPAQGGPSGRLQVQPPTRWRAIPRFDLGAFLGISVGIAIASALVYIVVRPPSWVLLVAIASGAMLLAGCVLVFPHLLAPSPTLEDLAGVEELIAKDRIQFVEDRRKLQNDVRTALLQAVVGGSVLVGVLFTWQQQQATSRQVADQLAVARQGQVGERFSRAVSQLGSSNMDIRLGGLYELEQLARQSPEHRLVIVEVVAAYIRQHGRPPAKTTRSRADVPRYQNAPVPPQDIAAALTILGRRSIHEGDPWVNLRGARLYHFFLGQARLHQVDLALADLRGTSLFYADLGGAFLVLADLRGAFLAGANLRGADLGAADLRGANLGSAELRREGVPDADLTGARANALTRWPDGFDWRGAGVEYRP
jgi:Pentapeptide repeats (8 copies)